MNTIHPNTSTWTPERKAKLRQLHNADELSTTEIGECLGVTKSAVCGALHRMGLSRPGRNPIKNTKIYKRTIARNAARRELAAAAKRQNELDAGKLGEGGCRFIAGDVKARPAGVEIEEMHCNHPLQPGSSYCARHHSICCMPVPKKKRRKNDTRRSFSVTPLARKWVR